MNKTPHPTASLIKQLHFSGRRVTFKVTDMEDRKHTVSGYHNEKWVDIDNSEDLKILNYYLKNSKIKKILNTCK